MDIGWTPRWTPLSCGEMLSHTADPILGNLCQASAKVRFSLDYNLSTLYRFIPQDWSDELPNEVWSGHFPGNHVIAIVSATRLPPS